MHHQDSHHNNPLERSYRVSQPHHSVVHASPITSHPDHHQPVHSTHVTGQRRISEVRPTSNYSNHRVSQPHHQTTHMSPRTSHRSHQPVHHSTSHVTGQRRISHVRPTSSYSNTSHRVGGNNGLHLHDLDRLQSSIKSEDDAVNCTVGFFNRTCHHIQIFWIDYEGKFQDYGKVEPNSSWNQDSCVTWPWIIKQHDKNVCIYVPQFGLRDNAHVTLTVHEGGSCVLGGDAQNCMRTSNMRTSNMRSSDHCHESRVVERECNRSFGSTYYGSENVRQSCLPDIVNRPSITRNTMEKEVCYNVQKPHVNEKYVDKFYDVIVEKPVAHNREVEVPYDVFIEKPIEKVIEKEVITEVYVDRHYDRIIEIPVQKIVEVHVEKIVERPIYIDEIVEVPTERVIESYCEQIIENIIYEDSTVEIDERDCHKYRGSTILPTRVEEYHEDVRVERPVYVDNIIEKIVEQPYDVVIEHVVEHKCHRNVEYDVERPVYRDNIIEKIVEVERPYTRRVNKEYHVDRPVTCERIIEREVHVPTYVEKVVEIEKVEIVERCHEVVHEVHVDKWYEKEVCVEVPVHQPVYIDNIIRKPIYRTEVVEQPVENIVHRHYDVIVEQEVPVEHVRYETIERPYDNIIECAVEKIIECEYERVCEKPVYTENIIEREVVHENIVHDYVDNIVERAVHKDNIIEQEVLIETTVHKPVETIIEKEVKVEIISYINVPVDCVIERPVEVPYYVEKEVVVQNRVERPREKITEIETAVDVDLQHHLNKCKEIEGDLQNENHVYKQACEEIEHKWRCLQQEGPNDWMAQCARARRQIVETELALSSLAYAVHQQGTTIEKKTTVMYSEDPEAAKLRQEIKDRSTQNAMLRSKISFHVQRTSEIRHSSGSPNRSTLRKSNLGETTASRRLVDTPMHSSHLKESNFVENNASRRLIDAPMYSSHAGASNSHHHPVTNSHHRPVTSTRYQGVQPLTSNITFGGSRAVHSHANNRHTSMAAPNNVLTTSLKR